MLKRIGMIFLLVLRFDTASCLGQSTTNDTKMVQSGVQLELQEFERQIETVLSEDSKSTSKQETRRMLEMVIQQFPILDLSRSMVERHRLQQIYEVLETSNRARKGIVFEVFSGAQYGFLAFRVGSTIFVSTELFSLPDVALEGVLAHELSHDERDYKRKLLIDMNNLEPDLKQALKVRLESRADEGAIRILSKAGRDLAAVKLYLEIFRKNGRLRDTEFQLRLAAERAGRKTIDSTNKAGQ